MPVAQEPGKTRVPWSAANVRPDSVLEARRLPRRTAVPPQMAMTHSRDVARVVTFSLTGQTQLTEKSEAGPGDQTVPGIKSHL